MAAVLAAFLLAGCASWHTASQVNALLPTDVILLGEQHDVAEHQRIEARAVRQLVIRDKLAALVVEMADAGQDTRALSTDATEAAVREALEWNDKAWPWGQYGPAVMEAVRAGVLVLGGNLPRRLFSSAMADHALDAALPPPALAAQQAAIRHGHCDLLAASQLVPMTRIQIARDQSMAKTLQAAVRSGQAVVLLAGSGHVDRELGVPRHLPASLAVRVVRLQAGGEAKPSSSFDAIWTTPQATGKDYCADLRLRLGQ